MFGWMSVQQLISFTAPFYPTWNHDWANHLAKKFELPMKTKVKHLSKGQGVRLGLLLALAHHPRLIILDDPTLGLDPIVRHAGTEDLRDSVKQIIMPAREFDELAPLPGVLDVKRRKYQVAVVVEDVERALPLVRERVEAVEIVDLNLDEIFEAYVIGNRNPGKEDGHVAKPGLERVA